MDDNERELFKEILHYDTGYERKLLRVLLSVAFAAVLLLDAILTVLCLPDWGWLVIPALLADGFAWMLALDFVQDARSARVYEHENHRLSLEMRYTLRELSAARLRQVLEIADEPEADEEPPQESDPAPEQPEEVKEARETFRQESGQEAPSRSSYGYGTLFIEREAGSGSQEGASAASGNEQCLVGISRDFPDPVARWGLVRVREFHQQMETDFARRENSTYAFLYGVVSGKAVSQTEWYARGMSKRTHAALMELLERAGVVEGSGQGKPRRVLINNPVQAWLVASEKHHQEEEETYP